MKKALLALLAAAVLVLVLPGRAHAGVDDFRFSSMSTAYTLGVDAEGRSTLRTVETLTAEFPASDQNHGIRRVLNDRYDGHPTDLKVVSVTDGDGRDRPFDVDGGDDDTTAVTSSARGFVHGTQVYVITYEQANVTLQRADSGNDEFYWDVNGTDWAQPFDRVAATLTVSPALADALTGDRTAVSGREGSTTSATIDQPSARTVTASASDLAAGETLTMAVGFRAGTFTPRADGVLAAPWPLLSLGGGLLALLGAVGAVLARRGPLRNAAGRPTVVTEFDPPEGMTIPFAGHLASKTPTAAEFLGLAVKGCVQLVEKPGKRKPTYALRFVTVDGADRDDLVFLDALFGDSPQAGAEFDLVAKNATAVRRLSGFFRTLPVRALDEGYRRPGPGRLVAPIVIAAVVGGLAAIVFGIVSIGTVVGGGWPIAALIVGFVAIGVGPALVARRPLTKRGAEVRDHLAGLERYTKLAEADRLAALQSPEGALRMPGIGAESWLLLNERLLPWAALFGQQKRWSDELGRLYADRSEQPSWYSGQTPFSPAVFAAAVGGFQASTTSAFSSTTGGSTGGAVAGGGGGGGGGGGT